MEQRCWENGDWFPKQRRQEACLVSRLTYILLKSLGRICPLPKIVFHLGSFPLRYLASDRYSGSWTRSGLYSHTSREDFERGRPYLYRNSHNLWERKVVSRKSTSLFQAEFSTVLPISECYFMCHILYWKKEAKGIVLFLSFWAPRRIDKNLKKRLGKYIPWSEHQRWQIFFLYNNLDMGQLHNMRSWIFCGNYKN